VDYESGPKQRIGLLALDDLELDRVDFIKIDVEGMELEVLQGAERTIDACRPIMMIEYVKSRPVSLQAWLEDHGYRWFMLPMNILAVHEGDPCLESIPQG
jgi:hypothetical protein